MSLGVGFETLKACTPSPELLCLSTDQDVTLSYCSSSGHTCCHAPAVMNAFLEKLAWSWCPPQLWCHSTAQNSDRGPE